MKSLSPNKLASSSSSASGGTTLPSANDGQALIRENGQWVAGPVIGGVDYITSGDADYSSVSVLLLGNGSDGSTTFTDSSSSPFTFTGNGAAEISTTQSKFGGASISLPSSTASYLSTTSDSSLSLDGDFTIEAWVYNTGGGTYRPIIGSGKTSWGGGAFAVDIYTGGANPVLTLQQHSGAATLTGTTALSLNTWHHVAVTRTGSTVRLFVDGVEDGSVSTTGTYDFGNNNTFYVGKHGWGSDEYHGYIDDLRITKGVARYTANFTPPTAELESTAAGQITIPYSIDKLEDVDTSTVAPTDGQALLWDAVNNKWEPGTIDDPGDAYYNNVEVLLHFNGTDGSTTFTDDSSNSWTVAANNQAQISTTQSKFGGASFYSGSSTSFNAALIANNSALTLDAAFTIEAWIYAAAIPGNNDWAALISKWSSGGEYNILLRDNGSISFGWGSYNANSLDSPLLRSGANTISTNTWIHIAVTRSGNDFKMYIDGTQADSATHSSAPSNTSSGLTIGAFSSSDARRFNGYIDELRITKGVARYTSAFSVPTAAFSNTQATPTGITTAQATAITLVFS